LQSNLIISSNQSLDFKREMFPQTFPNQIHSEVTRLVFRHYHSLGYQLYTRVLLRLRQQTSTHPKVSSYPTFHSCFSYFWGEVQCKDDWTGMRMSTSSMFIYHLKITNLKRFTYDITTHHLYLYLIHTQRPLTWHIYSLKL